MEASIGVIFDGSFEGSIGVIFDGSFEGFLNVVYAYYYEKIKPLEIVTEEGFQQTLGTNYLTIVTDEAKAARVMNGIQQKISTHCGNLLTVVYMHKAEQRFLDMFWYVIFGFQYGHAIENMLTFDCVGNMQSYYRNVTREAMKQQEFCRFAETKSGIYYCDIAPENNILPLVADFFVGRFPEMKWVIHDVGRGLAVIYDGVDCVFREVPHQITVAYTEQEETYQQLWVQFFKSIAIKERINPKLQRNLLPKRYRKYMTEFKRW